MIEMSKPEEILPPECVPMAKGEVPLPESTSIEQIRRKLKQKLENNEELSLDEMHKVNTFSRMDLMKAHTQKAMASIQNKRRKPDVDNQILQEMMDTYDLLAMDWVYSDRLEWDGSMADVQLQKILGAYHREEP